MNNDWEIEKAEKRKAEGKNTGTHTLKEVMESVDSTDFEEVKQKLDEEAKQKRKEGYDIFTVDGQVNYFYECQPFFYDTAKLFHLWNDKEKKWEMCDEIDMMNKLKENIPQANTINSKLRTEILNSMKQLGRDKHPKDMPKTWIQFKDKIIDVITEKEFPATSKYYTTNPIPHKIGKSSDTPTIDKLIKEWVVEGTYQDESYVKTMKQIIAYTVSSDQFLQRMIALCGAGMNGKGTFIKLLENFVGTDNCCASDLRILVSNNFEASALYKKLLCVMGEVDASDLKNTNTIKKLSGEDRMRYEFKGKGSFTDTSQTTCVIATNSLPTTPDKSLGFYRRWLIVDFPHQFSVKRDLLGKIPEEEYENLGRCILDLLREMYKTNKFENEGELEERMERYEERSNPLMRYIDECCEEVMEGKVELREFCSELNKYLKSKHLRVLSVVQVGKLLRNEGFEIKPRTIKKDFHEISAKCILGLKLKTTQTTETTQIQSHNYRIETSSDFGSFGSSSSFTPEELARAGLTKEDLED